MEPASRHFYCERIASPIGELIAVSDGVRLYALDFADCSERLRHLLQHYHGTCDLEWGADPDGAAAKMKRYFDGDLAAIEAIEVAAAGTAFQQRVWRALRLIPAGRTVSYGEFARVIGNSRAARAVGLANGSNPVAIVVPCHRLLGANGQLTGYGGGIWRKRWLLEHEGVLS